MRTLPPLTLSYILLMMAQTAGHDKANPTLCSQPTPDLPNPSVITSSLITFLLTKPEAAFPFFTLSTHPVHGSRRALPAKKQWMPASGWVGEDQQPAREEIFMLGNVWLVWGCWCSGRHESSTCIFIDFKKLPSFMNSFHGEWPEYKPRAIREQSRASSSSKSAHSIKKKSDKG